MTAPRHIDWRTVQDAFDFALAEHGDQARKGTDTPYMAHLWGTASLVLEAGGGTDDVVAALLHDTAEDQGGEETLARVEEQFGAHVAGMVRGLSDALPAHGEEKPPWDERKESYVAHLGEEPVAVLRISAADKLYNLRSMISDVRTHGSALWERFNQKDPQRHLWYFDALAAVYESRAGDEPGLAALARELRAAHGELSRLVAETSLAS